MSSSTGRSLRRMNSKSISVSRCMSERSRGSKDWPASRLVFLPRMVFALIATVSTSRAWSHWPMKFFTSRCDRGSWIMRSTCGPRLARSLVLKARLSNSSSGTEPHRKNDSRAASEYSSSGTIFAGLLGSGWISTRNKKRGEARQVAMARLIPSWNVLPGSLEVSLTIAISRSIVCSSSGLRKARLTKLRMILRAYFSRPLSPSGAGPSTKIMR